MTDDSKDLGYFTAADASQLYGSIHFGRNPEPIVTFRPDGTVEVRGDTYESAKAFWDYVRGFAEQSYAKHAATHHEIRDLGEFVAERKGKE